MRVLVAEDDPVSRRILTTLLNKWKYECIITRDGNEAWAAFENNEIDLALLDWMMPELSGVDLTKKIRRQETAAYVYIMLLTAKAQKEDVICGLEAGADDYITKPFHQGELLSRLKAGERIVRLERDLKDANDLLKIQASTDFLTSLLNHGAIMARLHEEWARASREQLLLSVIMADIDYFKRVNDEDGHNAGDKVLKEVAARIRRMCRNYDSVGRYGGEEFLIIVQGNDETADKVAERIRREIAEHSVILDNGKEIRVTISLGYAFIDDVPNCSGRALLKAADSALYGAKNAGRNRVVNFAKIV